jgi:uncharacterized protein YjiS (DUF1127 family)
METTLNCPVPVSRGLWSRLFDAVVGATSWLGATVRGQWQRWQAARLRDAELRALRELSPSVLRDIGAAPESIYEAQRRSERPLSARDAALRLM